MGSAGWATGGDLEAGTRGQGQGKVEQACKGTHSSCTVMLEGYNDTLARQTESTAVKIMEQILLQIAAEESYGTCFIGDRFGFEKMSCSSNSSSPCKYFTR